METDNKTNLDQAKKQPQKKEISKERKERLKRFVSDGPEDW